MSHGLRLHLLASYGLTPLFIDLVLVFDRQTYTMQPSPIYLAYDDPNMIPMVFPWKTYAICLT